MDEDQGSAGQGSSNPVGNWEVETFNNDGGFLNYPTAHHTNKLHYTELHTTPINCTIQNCTQLQLTALYPTIQHSNKLDYTQLHTTLVSCLITDFTAHQ